MIKKTTAIRFIILVLITTITIFVLKYNVPFKTFFYKHIYDNNISFASINNWYQSKFGSPLPFSQYFKDTKPVFKEQLTYSASSLYKDGVSLEVGNNYLVPCLDGGIVTFIGEKEGYGKTVIIEQASGVTVWYSNFSEINVKVYDYVSKGDLLGAVNDNLYLIFYKDGEVVDYKEYI